MNHFCVNRRLEKRTENPSLKARGEQLASRGREPAPVARQRLRQNLSTISHTH